MNLGKATVLISPRRVYGSMNQKIDIPQPRTHPLFGCVPDFRRDALGTLIKYATEGDVVRVLYGLLEDEALDIAQEMMRLTRNDLQKKTDCRAIPLPISRSGEDHEAASASPSPEWKGSCCLQLLPSDSK